MMRTAKRATLCVAIAAMILLPVQNIAAQSSDTSSSVKHLLDKASVFFSVTAAQCTSQACKDDAQQATVLVQNAEQDYTTGALTGANLKDFMENLKTATKQLHDDILNSMTPAENKQYQNCKSCQEQEKKMSLRLKKEKARVVSAVYHPGQGHIVLAQYNQCQECEQVAQELDAICLLYYITCPPCAEACEATVLYEEIQCLEQQQCE